MLCRTVIGVVGGVNPLCMALVSCCQTSPLDYIGRWEMIDFVCFQCLSNMCTLFIQKITVVLHNLATQEAGVT